MVRLRGRSQAIKIRNWPLRPVSQLNHLATAPKLDHKQGSGSFIAAGGGLRCLTRSSACNHACALLCRQVQQTAHLQNIRECSENILAASKNTEKARYLLDICEKIGRIERERGRRRSGLERLRGRGKLREAEPRGSKPPCGKHATSKCRAVAPRGLLLC